MINVNHDLHSTKIHCTSLKTPHYSMEMYSLFMIIYFIYFFLSLRCWVFIVRLNYCVFDEYCWNFFPFNHEFLILYWIINILQIKWNKITFKKKILRRNLSSHIFSYIHIFVWSVWFASYKMVNLLLSTKNISLENRVEHSVIVFYERIIMITHTVESFFFPSIKFSH